MESENMIEIVRKILMNKYVVFGILLSVLSLYCYYLRNEVKSLKLEIVQYEATVSNLNATIATKNDTIDVAKADTSISNDRLKDCYLQLKEVQSAQKEIDDIMSDTKEENIEDKSSVETIKKPSVTQHQEKRGLEFVNKQLQRISGE